MLILLAACKANNNAPGNDRQLAPRHGKERHYSGQ